ncbi:hypothetical protein MTP99_006123 [Tenebrio molitor]|nr:hypothetical protein MTP99_006123 [Tenebrio molitor]
MVHPNILRGDRNYERERSVRVSANRKPHTDKFPQKRRHQIRHETRPTSVIALLGPPPAPNAPPPALDRHLRHPRTTLTPKFSPHDRPLS